jgi:prepilin-type N-terminal cleavage/methylation domain-containing protein
MRAKDPADAGFTLIEVLTSLAVIGVVLTATTTYFIRSMVIVNLEGARQAAILVASTSMEQLRSVPGALALSWLVDNAAAEAVPMGSVSYTRSWDVPALSALIPATVHVKWPSRGCVNNICEYSTTTLISTATVEPVFDPASLP